MLSKSIKLQLDSGLDVMIINLHTKLGKLTTIITNKIARSVTGEKIKFLGKLIKNVTFKEKTLKLKMIVMRNTHNLFGTDWMEQFQ